MKTLIDRIKECANKRQATAEVEKYLHKKRVFGTVENFKTCEEYDSEEYELEIYIKQGERAKTVQVQGKNIYRIIYEKN